MLHCILDPDSGRVVVASRNVAAGEVIFAEEAYTVAPNMEHPKAKRCVHCASLVNTQFSRCEVCASAFCSEVCDTTHRKNHVEHGECAALLFAQLMRAKVPEEDFETFQMTCLIIARCAAEGREKLLARDIDAASVDENGDTISARGTIETVGLGQESANPLVFLNDHSTSAGIVSSYEHVECLITNVKGLDPEIVKDFSHLYDLYMEGVSKPKLMRKLQHMQLLLPPTVSRITFLSICCAFLCNGFGFWDSRGRKQATAIYPRSSYFNHSCAPNLGRRNVRQSRLMEFFAARNIAQGEQLCISYIDVRLPAAERVTKLKATYTFICQCQRCSPDADYLLANTLSGGAVPPLCSTCQCKVLQPLPDGMYLCPCCDTAQTVEA